MELTDENRYTYRKRLVKPNSENLKAIAIKRNLPDAPDYCEEFIFKYFTRGGKVLVYPDQWKLYDDLVSMPEGIGPYDAVKLIPPDNSNDMH
jgi:hypothetical protein